MRWSARTIVLVGLGVGVAASGATILWHSEHSPTSTHAGHYTIDSTQRGTPQDLVAIETEVQRWKSELKSDLTALRSQITRLNREQDATGQQLNQLADTLNQAGGKGATIPARGEGAEAAALTPEQERERAAARTQAQLALMEGTLRAEQRDPAWASTAQLALQAKFQKEAISGVQLVDAECRSTLCRMELSVDDSVPQDSLRHLLNLAPWSGPSLIQIDTETGEAVMYLAREEYLLPQAEE